MHTIYTTSATPHHQHILINTSRSTSHHLHNTNYTTPSTQHHLHYIIKHWQGQHLEHCHLTPSASFPLIPLFVFLLCGLFFVFVSLTYSTVGCPKALLTCGVIRPYNARLFFRLEVVCIFDDLDAVTDVMPRPGVENSVPDATCDVPH